jgi:hypothetical protein
MVDVLNYPIPLFVAVFFVLWASVYAGVRVRAKNVLQDSERRDLEIILSGTAYVRAGLLVPAEAARTRELLRRYTTLRIEYYTTRDGERLATNAGETATLQNDLWHKRRQGCNPPP